MFRLLSTLLGVLAVLAPAALPAANQPPAATAPFSNLTLARGAPVTNLTLGSHFQDPDVPGTAVRVTVRIGNTGTQTFDLALFDQQTPVTVANFLAYINAGRFRNNIVHRSMPDFVIQGGGFFFVNNTTFDFVPTFAMIQNEPGLSNVRGTVAMAKIGDDPNSATSQWFINLSDENVFLDEGPPVSNTFTVFGRVLGDGMDVVDDIAALPVYDVSGVAGAWTDLPLSEPELARVFFVETNMAVVPALAYAVASSDATVVAASLLNGATLQLRPSATKTGTATIAVTATDLSGAQLQRTFTVTVPPPPGITAQPPASVAGTAGGAAITISVTVTGAPAFFQWQRLPAGGKTWVNLTDDATFSGTATATLQINHPSAAMNGDQYRCLVTNGLALKLTSKVTKVNVAFMPAITLHPANAAIKAPGAAIFKVAANGNPAPAFTWQMSADGGATWTAVANGGAFSGATTATLKVVTSAVLHGRMFRAVATNSAGGATSNPATLAVTESPKITAQSPATVTGNAGAALTLTVSATGNPAPAFQWKKNNVNIPNATGAALTLDPLAPGDAATYTVVASNGVLPNATSKPVKVVVAFAPQFTLHPANVAIKAPGAAIFKVAANGNPAPAFTWQMSADGGATWTAVANGGAFSGATTATLKVVTSAVLHGRMFRAIATNSAGSATSNPATLAVTESPKITAQSPATVTGNAGAALTLTVSATGNPAPAFQWKKNNVNIPNATGAALTLDPLAPGDAATYTVVASNGVLPNATSKPVKVVVAFAPQFTLHPANVAIKAPGAAIFKVAANGNPAPAFTWQMSADGGATWTAVANGGAFSGATTATLKVVTSAVLHGRMFRAIATNSAGSATSNPATLAVTESPKITAQSPATLTGNAGAALTLTVSATGNPAPAFQWKKNNVNIPNATGAALTLDPLAPGDAATYTVVASNGVLPNATSKPVKVVVAFAPQFTLHPANVAIKAPGAAIFKVAANGNPAPAFTWQMSADGGATWTAVANGGAFSGATTATLKVVTSAVLHGRMFRAIATNSAGSATSNPATLAVTESPKITAQSPATLTGNAGAALTLTVSATGNPAPAFQWKKNNVNLPGQTGATLTLDPLAPGDAATYTVVAGNGVLPNATAKPVKVVVAFAPQFALHPASAAIKAPGAAIFKVTATGNPAPAFTWQMSLDGGTTWTAVANGGAFSGATTATLKVVTSAVLHGRMFRAVATNSAGGATSNPATLAVTQSPVFTVQPAVLTTVNAGGAVTLTVAAGGNPAPALQWRKNGVNLPAQTGPTLTLAPVTAADAGTYTVVAGNGVLPNATSKPAKVVVNFAPQFTLQPANVTARERAFATFKVAAKGLPVATTYQWQFSTDNGTTWENVTNGGGVTGATTAALRVTADLLLTGRQFRCAATNSAGSTISNAAILTVTPVPLPAR